MTSKRKDRAADALVQGLALTRAGMQKFQECYLELGDMPQTQGVRDARRRIKIMEQQLANATKGMMRAVGKSDIADNFDEHALDWAERQRTP